MEVDSEELPESSLFEFFDLYCLLLSDNSMQDFGLILPKKRKITLDDTTHKYLTLTASMRMTERRG